MRKIFKGTKTKSLLIHNVSISAPEGTYSGVRDVFRHLMREEGIRGMYKGAVPVLLRAFPANACCFMGYEVAMYGLNKVAPNL